MQFYQRNDHIAKWCLINKINCSVSYWSMIHWLIMHCTVQEVELSSFSMRKICGKLTSLWNLFDIRERVPFLFPWKISYVFSSYAKAVRESGCMNSAWFLPFECCKWRYNPQILGRRASAKCKYHVPLWWKTHTCNQTMDSLGDCLLKLRDAHLSN